MCLDSFQIFGIHLSQAILFGSCFTSGLHTSPQQAVIGRKDFRAVIVSIDNIVFLLVAIFFTLVPNTPVCSSTETCNDYKCIPKNCECTNPTTGNCNTIVSCFVDQFTSDPCSEGECTSDYCGRCHHICTAASTCIAEGLSCSGNCSDCSYLGVYTGTGKKTVCAHCLEPV